MRVTVEFEKAFESLQHNDDFRKFLTWVGVEAELANQRLIFNRDEDLAVLQGRTQALVQLIQAIDEFYKSRK